MNEFAETIQQVIISFTPTITAVVSLIAALKFFINSINNAKHTFTKEYEKRQEEVMESYSQLQEKVSANLKSYYDQNKKLMDELMISNQELFELRNELEEIKKNLSNVR